MTHVSVLLISSGSKVLIIVALVVVYDYHPNATTLFENHVKAKAGQVSNGRGNRTQERIPERTLWSYIVQIASAVKAVHDAGLSVRVIDVTKVLITSKNRFVIHQYIYIL